MKLDKISYQIKKDKKIKEFVENYAHSEDYKIL